MTLITDSQPAFQKALDHLSQELSVIRTGRATPALVENLQVEAYGAQQPLKALASISTPDSKTVQIEPWDSGVTKSIETAIQKSDIGINPNVDGKVIRLQMPMMTDETRQQMAKVVKEKLEHAKIAIRQVREEVKKQIDKLEGVGDDDKHNLQQELEDVVKDHAAKIDELGEKKIEDITTI